MEASFYNKFYQKTFWRKRQHTVLELLRRWGGFPPTAVVSPYTLQWAALRRLGVVPLPHYIFP